MRQYSVDWAKTYVASGTVIVAAFNKEDAEQMVLEKIGDLQGSMQYDPNEDYVEAQGE